MPHTQSVDIFESALAEAQRQEQEAQKRFAELSAEQRSVSQQILHLQGAIRGLGRLVGQGDPTLGSGERDIAWPTEGIAEVLEFGTPDPQVEQPQVEQPKLPTPIGRVTPEVLELYRAAMTASKPTQMEALIRFLVETGGANRDAIIAHFENSSFAERWKDVRNSVGTLIWRAKRIGTIIADPDGDEVWLPIVRDGQVDSGDPNEGLSPDKGLD